MKEESKSSTTCIRVFADQVQIDQCKEAIQALEAPITDYAEILKLAGSEVRMKILYLIHREEKLCVCDLSDILEMKIAAVSQHLRKLRDGGLLGKEKVGQTIFYFLHPAKKEVLTPLFKHIEQTGETV